MPWAISKQLKYSDSIAAAFIATLWAFALANLLYLPIADKLKAKHQDEGLCLEIITEGVMSLAMGDIPGHQNEAALLLDSTHEK